jgi:hypothetical protein
VQTFELDCCQGQIFLLKVLGDVLLDLFVNFQDHAARDDLVLFGRPKYQNGYISMCKLEYLISSLILGYP